MSGSGFSGIYTEGDHGSYNTIKMLPNSGHLLISVAPSQATVDYISSAAGTNGTVMYSYAIAPNGGPSPGIDGGLDAGHDAGPDAGLDAGPDAGPDAEPVVVPLALEGDVSMGTADGVSTMSFGHTAGTGAARLMLVGISANSYGSARTLSSVTFTPSGGSATALSPVGSIENGSGRLAAIYYLLNPPSGVSGTVAVTFSGSVGYGIVAGAANFQGVDQAAPLGQFASATGTTSAISLSVPSDEGDLVFDTVFLGAATPPTATAGAAQSPLWNTKSDRAGGAASMKAAGGAATTMSWTASANTNWAAGGVSINPSGGG
jgi:hypothetical protein